MAQSSVEFVVPLPDDAGDTQCRASLSHSSPPALTPATQDMSVCVCVCVRVYVCVCVCVRVCGNGSHLTRTTWQCKCRGTTVVVKARLIVVKRITSQSNCVHICVRVCVCVCVCVCTSRE